MPVTPEQGTVAKSWLLFGDLPSPPAVEVVQYPGSYYS